VRQGTGSDSWLVFDDHEPGQARLDHIEHLLQLGGPVGLRLCRCALPCTRPTIAPLDVVATEHHFLHTCRAGGLLSARYDQRLDWKTSRGQDYFVLSSCVPWNLIDEAVRRLQREEDSARELGAASAADRWASLKEELTCEVRCSQARVSVTLGSLAMLSNSAPGRSVSLCSYLSSTCRGTKFRAPAFRGEALALMLDLSGANPVHLAVRVHFASQPNETLRN
jgi:hypothetical protein